ncbi:MAG: hypothetical protein JW976_10080 [Syntrophaceae bacterium]|nr:hypothetical protein [Syntrophaceae bacterium]
MRKKRFLIRILLYCLMLMFLIVIGCDIIPEDIRDEFCHDDDYSISGRVTLSGVGLSNVAVHLTGGDTQTAITDQRGDYKFSNLDNGEEYTLSPSSGTNTFNPSSIDVRIHGSSIKGVNFATVPCCISITVNRVYVSNYNDNSVSVIDSTTNNIIATIGLTHKAGASAFLPELNRLYVTSMETDEITVIDTLTNAVITTINLPGRTGSIVADSTTNKIYVAEHGNNSLLPLGTQVWVINGSSYALIDTITVGTNIQNLAIDIMNRRIFLTDFHSSAANPGLIFPINISTNVALTGISCGILPSGTAVHSTTHRAYATNSGDDSVTVIDTIDNSVVKAIIVGDNPQAIAVDETIDRGIVTNYNDNNVTLINTSKNKTVDSPVNVGTHPAWVSIDSVRHLAYVVNFDSNSVSVINIQTGVVIDTITVGDSPFRVTVVE